MKKRAYRIALAVSLFLGGCESGQEMAADVPTSRTRILPAIGTGEHAVATSYFSLDYELQRDGTFADYEAGRNGRYIDQLLATGTGIQFDIVVPDEPTIYGSRTGETVPYAGYVLYPTSIQNINIDYALPDGQLLPKMDKYEDVPQPIPADKGLPLVIYSHGHHGTPTDTFGIEFTRFLASHGYLVLSLYHGDARFRMPIELSEFQQLALRPLSIAVAIEQLLADPVFGPLINREQIAVAGGSYGGNTTYALAGGGVIGPTGNQVRVLPGNERIKAAVGIFPFLGTPLLPITGLNHEGGTTLDLPYLAIAGTSDLLSDYQSARATIDKAPRTAMPLLIGLHDETHEVTENVFSDIKTWVLTFLDAHIRGDGSATEYLLHSHSVEAGADDFVDID